MSDLTPAEVQTAALFGDLFAAYDDEAFKQSVELFARRFAANGFDLEWFKGKSCLDAGCGGGRYAIALARLGARRVVGVDISAESIADARRRAVDLSCSNIEFVESSLERLPCGNGEFDCVIHSGVLMHTRAPIKVMKELSRALRAGGLFYALVYATEGVRWPLVQMLRPIARAIGFPAMDEAVVRAGFPANRRRTYLDDLFVPYIDFYSWPCLAGILEDAGFTGVTRWSAGRLDQEEDIESYAKDLRGFLELFSAADELLSENASPQAALAGRARTLCAAAVDYVDGLKSDVRLEQVSATQARDLAIGQGHHRFIAWKSEGAAVASTGHL